MRAGLVQAGDHDGHNPGRRVPPPSTVSSPHAFKVPYLGLDGAFTIDTEELSATDPRNPKRVVFRKMEYFSFYADSVGATPLAEECRYVYKGAAGDPYYIPLFAKPWCGDC